MQKSHFRALERHSESIGDLLRGNTTKRRLLFVDHEIVDLFIIFDHPVDIDDTGCRLHDSLDLFGQHNLLRLVRTVNFGDDG